MCPAGLLPVQANGTLTSERVALSPAIAAAHPDTATIGRKSAGHTASEAYYPAFDVLRIVLALTVTLVHVRLLAFWEPLGNLAVQIFFALSGWLIGGILIRSTPRDLPRFYFNRAARIWIPYFVANGLLIVASLLHDPITAKWGEVFFYNFTFVFNFFGVPQLADHVGAFPLQGTGDHFWSICAEEQFYLVAPFLVTLLPRTAGKSIWLWSVLSACVLASPYWGYFGSISLGVLASVLRTRFKEWHLRPSGIVLLGLGAAAAVSAIYLSILPYRIAAPVLSICIVLLLARAGAHSRAASFVGGMSYPMYLNHWIGVFVANFVFEKIGLRGTWLCDVSSVILSVVIAAGLYLAVDRSVKERRDRYFSARRGKQLAWIGFTLVTIGLLVGWALQALSEAKVG